MLSGRLFHKRPEADNELAPLTEDAGGHRRPPPRNSLRRWLMENHYQDVSETIERIIDEWKRQGKGTRRNWWDVLAGDSHGKSKKIEGKEIPVLRIAQIRQGKRVTENALCRNENEKLPESVRKSRWD